MSSQFLFFLDLSKDIWEDVDSVKEALSITNREGYSIIPGQFSILPEHHEHNLDTLIAQTVIVPFIQNLIKEAPKSAEIVISCSNVGTGSPERWKLFAHRWKSFLNGEGTNHIEMNPELAKLIKEADKANLTSQLAELFGLEKTAYYNFTLGVLYTKRVHNEG